MSDAVELLWENKVYTITPDRMAGAIALVQTTFTHTEVVQHLADVSTLPVAKLATVYCALLKYAGAPADLTPEQVYCGILSTGSNRVQNILHAAITLLYVLVPAEEREKLFDAFPFR